MFNMPLSELLPTVSKLTHQDKLRLIHFLLLAIAKEEGCSLDTASNEHHEKTLMKQLTVTSFCVDSINRSTSNFGSHELFFGI